MSAQRDELDELLAHAKSVVNAKRKEAGLRALGKLKRGFPKSVTQCVITESLADAGAVRTNYDRTRHSVYCYGTEGGAFMLRDPQLARFMAAFDAGRYPDLIVKRKNDIKINKEVVIPKG